MKLNELPQPLQTWLHEQEGFAGDRFMRLQEELRVFGVERVLDWLVEAYSIGLKQKPQDTVEDHRPSGG